MATQWSYNTPPFTLANKRDLRDLIGRREQVNPKYRHIFKSETASRTRVFLELLTFPQSNVSVNIWKPQLGESNKLRWSTDERKHFIQNGKFTGLAFPRSKLTQDPRESLENKLFITALKASHWNQFCWMWGAQNNTACRQ